MSIARHKITSVSSSLYSFFGIYAYIFCNFFSSQVQGVCLALNDNLALVQRNSLDFLVQLLPLHITSLPQDHLCSVMTASLGVLLRRDMSLNRRLYAWILGANGEGSSGHTRSDSVSEEDNVKYFEIYGKTLVVKGLRTLFRQYTGTSVDLVTTKRGSKLELLKPFRIFLNLLDKPEVGSAILEDILIEVFKNLFQNWKHFGRDDKGHGKELRKRGDRSLKINTKEVSSKENVMEELIKTANLLFNTFEPYFMWQYIAKLLAQCNERSVCSVRNSENDVPGGESDGREEEKNDELVGKKDEQTHGEERLEIIEVIRLTDFILDIVALVRF